MAAKDVKEVAVDAVNTKYVQVLESYYQVSEELKRVQSQFQAEYVFAEEKMQAINLLLEFISSDKEIEKKYKEYQKKLKAEKK